LTPHTLSVFESLAWMLGAGLVATRLARRFGIPDLVLFVLVGVVLGPHGLGLVHVPAAGDVGQLVVTGGAVFMLYEGGRAIDLAVIRRIWLGMTLLATMGVVVTAAVVAVAAHAIAGVAWPVAWLAGAAIASTDPATIVPLFAQVKVRERIQQLVVSESAFNDATGAVLTMTVLGALVGGQVGVGGLVGAFLRLIVVGAVVGLGVGLLLQWAVAEARGRALFDVSEEHVVVSLLAMGASYAIASALGGSGFMAVFLAGILRGNASAWGLAPHPARARTHDDVLAHLGTVLRILIFAVLGANVTLPLLVRLGLPGLLVMAVFLFVARPFAVLLCLGLDRLARWSPAEMLFTAWVRETGVVPAALASLLLAARAPGAPTVAAFVFLAVVVTILVQGPTTAAWARRTGVAKAP
jgi:cell volume regulation protein A